MTPCVDYTGVAVGVRSKAVPSSSSAVVPKRAGPEQSTVHADPLKLSSPQWQG